METTDKTELKSAIAALGALAQEHRLALVRLLVGAGEDGMPAGAIAEALGVPNSSLSYHLAHLSRAGLVRHQRQHRSIIYTADYPAMNALVGYLVENCWRRTACGSEARSEGQATPAQPPCWSSEDFAPTSGEKK
jgi:DNA-binding transcriptional ArsR family regulator